MSCIDRWTAEYGDPWEEEQLLDKLEERYMNYFDVKYSCGHGTHKVYIDPADDRTEKISWYESTIMCYDCYRKRWHMADAKAQKKIHVLHLPNMSPLEFKCLARGQREANKEALRKIGFRWEKLRQTNDTGVTFDGWELMYNICASTKEELDSRVGNLVLECLKLGYSVGNESLLELNTYINAERTDPSQKAPKDAKDEPLPIPSTQNPQNPQSAPKGEPSSMPSTKGCFNFLRDLHGDDYQQGWDGKIRGKKNAYYYFFGGKMYSCTNEQRNAIVSYWQQVGKWRKKNNK